MVLLHLVRWLRDNTTHECHLLLLRGGPLEPDFARAATVVRSRAFGLVQDTAALRARVDRLHPRLKIVRRTAGPLGLAERVTRVLAQRGLRGRAQYDLVYCNTASCGAALDAMAPGCPVITHIHELEYALQMMRVSFAKTKGRTAFYIAASHAVRRNLVENHGIAPGAIGVVHEFVDTTEVLAGPGNRDQIRLSLGLSAEALLVGGCGPLEWRKGTDLFTQVARAAVNLAPDAPLHFVWIGGAPDGAYREELLFDLAKWGLTGRVHFVPEVQDPAPWLAALDVFALPSREDPFPLVCLESAAQGVPIVCFADAGGVPEFVETDCGLVTPYGDTAAMAVAVVRLVQDKVLRCSLGENAQHKVRARHDIAVAAPQILTLIERVAKFNEPGVRP